MDALKENLEEVEIGSSMESIQSLLESQKELFHSQIDQLQIVVVKQCQLTGVNPLAQEMAAGALSINIGKRPRDLLNPKAIKYMQAVFAIKDAISKKESREISALFGVTITQVRDFFASQRTRVRKQVRLSKEKSVRHSASKEIVDVVLDAAAPVEPVPLDSVAPISVEEAPSCSTQDDVPPGLDELDRHFVENIFSMMRKEETFSGQGKLSEWILKIQNSTVLSWFLTKGGVMILATWLTQAAIEEQTTTLDIIIKVLCHLPIHKALPEHMSAVLHSVNKLRFYRASDISNRARVLLSRWSKVFAKSQALKKPNGLKSSAEEQNELLLKQSIDEIMEDESWQSNVENPEGALVPSNVRKLEPPQAPKLLTAATDESSRKHALGASASHNRERRKVQLVEQPGQKTAGKGSQATKTAPVNQGRPMSTDDIQKAKMRALYMQSKYGKTGSSSNGTNEIKTESPNKISKTLRSSSSPISKSLVLSKPEEPKRTVVLPTKTSNRMETVEPNKTMDSQDSLRENIATRIRIDSLDRSQKMNSQELPWEKCQTSSRTETLDQIQNMNPQETTTREKCQTSNRIETLDQNQKMNPPEITWEKVKTSDMMEALGSNQKMDSEEPPWEKCKKVQIPWNTPSEIKLNDLWSVGAGENSKEIDIQKNRNRREKETIYITIQEIPPNPKEPWDVEMDYDDTLTPVIPSEQPPDTDSTEPQVNDAAPSSSSQVVAEPDLELLAVLLKNPDLVFALTSGNATNLTSQDTVKLLDMIKSGGAGLAANANALPKKVPEKVEVSLPSPTPSGNPGTSGWRPEIIRNPFSQHNSSGNRVAPASSSVLPHITGNDVSVPELLGNSPALAQQLVAAMAQLLPQSNARMMPIVTQNQAIAPTYAPNQVAAAPTYAPNQVAAAPTYAPNQVAAAPTLRVDSLTNTKPSSHPAFSSPTYISRQQIHLQPQQQQQPLTDPWRGRQGLASNSYPQAVPNHYNARMGGPGPARPQLRQHEYVRNVGFESWSPDNSPTRSPGYGPGRNPDPPGANPGWGYRQDGSWQQNSSGYRDYNRQGNRRWNDRRR